jgi:hypothetical protein
MSLLKHNRYSIPNRMVAEAANEMKPDFSGEWILNQSLSTLSPVVSGATFHWVLRITHREPNCRFEAKIDINGKPMEFTIDHLSDGREVTGVHERSPTVSSLRWDGDVLISMFRDESPNSPSTITFRYELIDGAARLRAHEEVRGSGRDQENIWVFERR